MNYTSKECLLRNNPERPRTCLFGGWCCSYLCETFIILREVRCNSHTNALYKYSRVMLRRIALYTIYPTTKVCKHLPRHFLGTEFKYRSLLLFFERKAQLFVMKKECAGLSCRKFRLKLEPENVASVCWFWFSI